MVDTGHDSAERRASLPGGVTPWVLLTVGVVVAGALAVLARPLAPDLGPLPEPDRWFATDLLTTIGRYRSPLRVVVVLGVLIDVAVPVVVAVTPAGRRIVQWLVDTVGVDRPVRAAVAVAVAVVAATAVVRAPLAVWRHVHARAFGLSTQSLVGWSGDWGIEVAVLVASTAVVALTGFALIVRWPRHWVLMAAPAGLVLVVIATIAAPLIIEPLRYDTTPLPDGPVRDALTPVLDADGGTTTTLLVADASRRTTRQNAYVSGLAGTRRIVLFDTLLERPPEEVALIVAHEVAHERNHDLLRGVLAGAAGLVVAVVVVHLVLQRRVRSGRQRSMADPRGAVVVVAVVMVFTVVTLPMVSWTSRRAEAAADLGSLRLSGATAEYCAVQRGLVERNLSDPAPPTWERLWWWTHPPAASRLELASRVGDGCDGAVIDP